MSSLNNVNERVDRGIKWLNERYPGWYQKVDQQKLDFGYIWNDVLGQLKAWDEINIALKKEEQANLGFFITKEEQDYNEIQIEALYSMFNSVWNVKITKLLNQEKDLEELKKQIVIPFNEMRERFPETFEEIAKTLDFKFDKDQANQLGISKWEFEARCQSKT